MKAADLDKRVRIERPARTVDPRTGERRPGGWELLAEVWAAVWPRGAAEREQAGQLGQRVTHEVRVRYLAGLATDCRIVYAGRVLQILSAVDPDEAHREHRIQAAEVTGPANG